MPGVSARPEFLLSAGFESLDALGGGQVFGHGAAEFLDGLANFGADLAVGAVGVGLADDALATELFFGLRRPEQVGGQLGAAHVVEDLLARLKLLPSVNVLRRQPAVQPLIAVILEDGVVPRLDDPGPSRRVGKLGVVRPQLLTQPQAPLRLVGLVAEFLPPSLYRKVRLPERHPRLARVRILNRQITSVPRQQRRLDRSLPALADRDHFVDINKMILDGLPAVQARQLGFFEHSLEVAPIGVSQRLGKLPTGPTLDAPRVHAPNAHKYRNVSFHGSHPAPI